MPGIKQIDTTTLLDLERKMQWAYYEMFDTVSTKKSDKL